MERIEKKRVLQQTISILKKEIIELKRQLEFSESSLRINQALDIKIDETREIDWKEFSYYRWFDQYIEQQASDMFYDSRNGNYYNTKAAARITFNTEYEAAEKEETEVLNKINGIGWENR